MLMARKNELSSHHCGRSKKRAPTNRMWSMRAGASRWMTSAPSAANTPVAAGPAHQAVRSRTRRPASGPGPAGSVGRARVGRGVVRPTARRAPAPGGRGLRRRAPVTVDRQGRDGMRKSPSGASTHALRAAAWSSSSTVRPLLTGATGTPSATARSMTCSVVCRAGPGVDDRVPLLPPLAPHGGHVELARLDQVGSFEHAQEGLEVVWRVRVEPDPPVGRRLDRRRLPTSHRPHRVAVHPVADGVHEVHEVAGAQVGHVAPREVHEQAAAVRPRRPPADEGGHTRVGAGEPVDRAPAHLHRGFVGPAADGQCAALGLDGEVAGRPVRERSREPERGDRDDREGGPTRGDGPEPLRAFLVRRREQHVGAAGVVRQVVHAHRGLALAQVSVERAVPVRLARRQPPPSHRVPAAPRRGRRWRRRGGAAARRTRRGCRRRCRAPSVPRDPSAPT